MTAFGDRSFRAACCAALTAALLLTMSGCGSSRDYAVPDDLCGVPIDPDVISPLLPDGDKLEKKPYAAKPPERQRCRVYVDGSMILWLAGDITDADTDVLKVKADDMQRDGNPAPADIADGATLADSGAVAVAHCTFEGKKHNFAVEVELGRDYPEKLEDRRKAVAKFFRAYVPAAVQRQGC
ncbi:hypothetical protein [Streptomyces sp. NPDC050560]|uniref:hypothetical protein n=1 Tax=Streptomyces sp. NPDC050560 TaxID=3365630 RepID=UPI0037AD5CEB